MSNRRPIYIYIYGWHDGQHRQELKKKNGIVRKKRFNCKWWMAGSNIF